MALGNLGHPVQKSHLRADTLPSTFESPRRKSQFVTWPCVIEFQPVQNNSLDIRLETFIRIYWTLLRRAEDCLGDGLIASTGGRCRRHHHGDENQNLKHRHQTWSSTLPALFLSCCALWVVSVLLTHNVLFDLRYLNQTVHYTSSFTTMIQWLQKIWKI